MRNNMTVREFLKSLREGKYTSVGSYPKFWLTRDGSTLSYEACRRHALLICRSIRDSINPEWRVIACDANWEDADMFCDCTHERIESAYAEDDAS